MSFIRKPRRLDKHDLGKLLADFLFNDCKNTKERTEKINRVLALDGGASTINSAIHAINVYLGANEAEWQALETTITMLHNQLPIMPPLNPARMSPGLTRNRKHYGELEKEYHRYCEKLTEIEGCGKEHVRLSSQYKKLSTISNELKSAVCEDNLQAEITAMEEKFARIENLTTKKFGSN